MANKPLFINDLLGNVGNQEQIVARGQIKPGYASSDALGSAPITFSVQGQVAGVQAFTSCSILAGATTVQPVAEGLSVVIKELIRKGILDGSYSQ